MNIDAKSILDIYNIQILGSREFRFNNILRGREGSINNNEYKNYCILIEAINIGELFYLLGDKIKSNRFYNYVVNKLDEYTDEIKLEILFELVMSFRRINSYKREYYFLGRILKYSNELLGKKLEYILNRIEKIDEYTRSDLTFDEKKLKYFEKKINYDKNFNNALKQMHSFQFEFSLKLFQQANELIDSNESIVYIGIVSYLLNNFEIATENFNKILNKDENNLIANMYLGTIKFIQNDHGMSEILKVISVDFKKGNDTITFSGTGKGKKHEEVSVYLNGEELNLSPWLDSSTPILKTGIKAVKNRGYNYKNRDNRRYPTLKMLKPVFHIFKELIAGTE